MDAALTVLLPKHILPPKRVWSTVKRDFSFSKKVDQFLRFGKNLLRPWRFLNSITSVYCYGADFYSWGTRLQRYSSHKIVVANFISAWGLFRISAGTQLLRGPSTQLRDLNSQHNWWIPKHNWCSSSKVLLICILGVKRLAKLNNYFLSSRRLVRVPEANARSIWSPVRLRYQRVVQEVWRVLTVKLASRCKCWRKPSVPPSSSGVRRPLRCAAPSSDKMVCLVVVVYERTLILDSSKGNHFCPTLCLIWSVKWSLE